MSDDDETASNSAPDSMFGANSPLSGRADLANALGKTFGGDRDIYETLGYDEDPTVEDYRARYQRQDIARAVIDKPAETTWREEPELTDDEDKDNQTPFESDVETLYREHELQARWEAVDRLAGIGHFGLLILGFADDAELSEPVNAARLSGPEDLAYIMPVGEDRVEGWDLVQDDRDERFGLPNTYEIDLSRDDSFSTEDTFGSDTTREVHWERVIHVPAGNTLDNELIGRPRLEAVYNRLQDLEKVVGGSAEMFWRAADYGLALSADPEYAGQMSPDDRDRMEEELEAWYHGMQPFLRLSGMEVERLGGDEADPTGIVEQILKLIAGETGIPQRILTGSERGELASTQDRASWLGHIAERQRNFGEPKVVRATFDRFIDFGVVTSPADSGYEVDWPNLFELSEVERAEVANQLSAALKASRRQGANEPVLSQGEVRQEIFGLDPELGSEVDIDEDLPTDEDMPGTEDMLPPDQKEPPDPPDEMDEDDEEVQDQFEKMQTLDALADGGEDPDAE